MTVAHVDRPNRLDGSRCVSRSFLAVSRRPNQSLTPRSDSEPSSCTPASYDWGTIGDKSTVARFSEGLPGFKIDSSKPYAELWMGTHPSKPSTDLESGKALADILHDDSSLIGETVRKRFGDDLPYLFKVLAVGKALSIQAHPDKTLGAKLHKEKPDVYKDPNHKPEMAIALTPFSGFCGFMPLDQVAQNIKSVPEFADVVGKAGSSFVKAAESADKSALATSAKERPEALAEALKSLFSSLMEADEDKTIKPNVQKLVARYQKETGKQKSSDLKHGTIEELVLRLNEQFPDDIGIFCAYLLNVVVLQPGEACFLQANEPHAYLQGDIIECMATSDNVVRAGLTPKLRDVPTLTSMLTYTWAGPDAQRMEPRSFGSCQHTKLYDPPIDEFSVALIDTKSVKEGEERHPAIDGPSILIVTELEGEGGAIEAEGQEKKLEVKRPGQVFFIGANTEVRFKAKMVAYRAYVTVSSSSSKM